MAVATQEVLHKPYFSRDGNVIQRSAPTVDDATNLSQVRVARKYLESKKRIGSEPSLFSGEQNKSGETIVFVGRSGPELFYPETQNEHQRDDESGRILLPDMEGDVESILVDKKKTLQAIAIGLGVHAQLYGSYLGLPQVDSQRLIEEHSRTVAELKRDYSENRKGSVDAVGEYLQKASRVYKVIQKFDEKNKS